MDDGVCVLQNSMNLPPDKVRLLRQYDNEKKWELICDQVSDLTDAQSLLKIAANALISCPSDLLEIVARDMLSKFKKEEPDNSAVGVGHNNFLITKALKRI